MRNIFLTICFVLPTFLFAKEPMPVLVQKEHGNYELAKYMEILEDKEGKWTIEQLLSPSFEHKFQSNESGVVNHGFTSSVYWIRMTFVNQDHPYKDWFLEVAYPMLDHIQFYLLDTDRLIYSQETGDNLPFKQRSVSHRNFIFNFPLSLQQVTTVYLRVQTQSSMQFPATLWSSVAFAEKINREQSALGLYYGALLVMLIYNLFLFFGVRDVNYLYYAIYIIGYGLFQFSLNGLAYQLLWPELPWWGNRSVPFFIGFGWFGIMLFTKYFLDTKKSTPRLHWGITFFWLFTFVTMGLALMASYGLAIRIAILNAFGGSVTAMIAGIITYRSGYRAAKFYVIAWFGLLSGIVLYVLKTIGLFPPNLFTEYALQVGSVMEVVLLSFALADRINIIKKEKAHALKLQLEESQKVASLSKTFEKFVPRQFLDRIAKKGIGSIELGTAEMDNITVLFCDIRSFTTLSETLSPQELLNFLNAYFKRMNQSIHQHHGFIDKFIGDAIMALFAASNRSNEEGALDAVRAAISMQKAIREYNLNRVTSGYLPISAGIGIHSGPVIIGTVGSEDRMDSTVLGDVVNLASRLESLTKQYHARIIISSQTFDLLGEEINSLQWRELDFVSVKGKDRPVSIFEIMDCDDERIKEKKCRLLEPYNEGLTLYHSRKWKEALHLFQECLKIFPEDVVSKSYVERCEEFIIAPPSDDWYGKRILFEK